MNVRYGPTAGSCAASTIDQSSARSSTVGGTFRPSAVIVAAGSTPAALTAKAATRTIPVVFLLGSDPVAAGLVDNLARPGGNVTGVTALNVELGPKRLELLRELVPTANVVALLVNPTNPFIAQGISKDLQSIAPNFGLQVEVLNASTERDFDTAFATLANSWRRWNGRALGRLARVGRRRYQEHISSLRVAVNDPSFLA